MKFDELDINKWEDFESKSIDLTPFDKFSWKKIWVNSFDENYNYQLAYNHNFFIPIIFIILQRHNYLSLFEHKRSVINR